MMSKNTAEKEMASEFTGEATDAATSKVVRAARVILLVAIALFVLSVVKGLFSSIDSTHIFISVAILASVLISCYLIERINGSSS
jgi:uncharacterized membrane protein YtjA (UPF0391 family)